MAQNFINLFETDSLYNAAKSGLSQPNVSLVKDSGNIHYTRHSYGLAASELGDIILEDSNRLYSVNIENYNLTDFPLATYTPIGINVYPASEAPDGKGRVLSLKRGDWNDLGNFDFTTRNLFIGPSNSQVIASYVEDGVSKNTIEDLTSMNGKFITQYVANNKIPVDWSGTTIGSSRDNYVVFAVAARLHTQITNEGDWYIPTYAEMAKYVENFQLLLGIYGNILDLLNQSSFKNSIFNSGKILTVTGTSQNNFYITNFSNGLWMTGYGDWYYGLNTPFMLQIGVEEV